MLQLSLLYLYLCLASYKIICHAEAVFAEASPLANGGASVAWERFLSMTWRAMYKGLIILPEY
jgi:hypothetical protein